MSPRAVRLAQWISKPFALQKVRKLWSWRSDSKKPSFQVISDFKRIGFCQSKSCFISNKEGFGIPFAFIFNNFTERFHRLDSFQHPWQLQWVPRRQPRWVGDDESSSEGTAREAGTTADLSTLSTLSMLSYLSCLFWDFRETIFGRWTWRTSKTLSGWTVGKLWSIDWWLAATTWVPGLVFFLFFVLDHFVLCTTQGHKYDKNDTISETWHRSYFSEFSQNLPNPSTLPVGISIFQGFAASCIKNDLHKNINLSSPELQETFWTQIDEMQYIRPAWGSWRRQGRRWWWWWWWWWRWRRWRCCCCRRQRHVCSWYEFHLFGVFIVL